MDNFEKVEKLRQHANVSYEEAKEALERSDWDILDAMIYLEKTGKVKEDDKADYSTKNERCDWDLKEDKNCKDKGGIADLLKRFGKWCIKIIDKGNRNNFCIERDNKEILKVPVTVLVIATFFAFWVIVPLLIIGLFCRMKYYFQGPDMQTETVELVINKAMDNASSTAENIKSEFNQAVANEEEHREHK